MQRPSEMRERTLKRKRTFDNVVAMFANFEHKPPYQTWRREIARLLRARHISSDAAGRRAPQMPAGGRGGDLRDVADFEGSPTSCEATYRCWCCSVNSDAPGLPLASRLAGDASARRNSAGHHTFHPDGGAGTDGAHGARILRRELSAKTKPWSFAKGSRRGRDAIRTPSELAACPAISTLTNRAMIASAMSIPAGTPAEVANLPSSTQRACLTHWTVRPLASTHANERLLVVARRPSSSPARASRPAPVHTEVTNSAVSARARNHEMSLTLSTSRRVPIPPGTSITSSRGRSSKPNSASACGPCALATGRVWRRPSRCETRRRDRGCRRLRRDRRHQQLEAFKQQHAYRSG